MPIYPPGNPGEKNGFPAYREYAENNQNVGAESIELFPATANREQRQIYIFNEGPSTVHLSYGLPATLSSPLRLSPGRGWLDSYDGGMALNAIGTGASAIKAFIRSEGPIILPPPPEEPSLNIEAIQNVSWVVDTQVQPSYQVFRTTEENPSIRILDTNNVMRENSWAGAELWASSSTENNPTGVDNGIYIGSWPTEEDGFTFLPEALYTWQVDDPNYGRIEYFWIKANLGLGDYNFIYFSLTILGNSLMEIVDFHNY